MRRTVRANKGFWTNEIGNAVIEFVVILPIFLGALAISFEFGRALWAHQIVTKGVRDATRFLARAPLKEPYLTQAFNLATTGAVSGGTSKFPWTATSTVNLDQHVLDFTNANFRAAGSVIQVHARVPMSFPYLAFFGLGTDITLDVTDQARYIGE